MIELSLTQALSVYSVLLLLIIGGIWFYTELSVRRPQRSLGKQFLWRCAFCGCTYLDEAAHQISQCPRCESFNDAEEAADPSHVTRADPPSQGEADEDKGRNTSRRKRHHQRRRGPRRRR